MDKLCICVDGEQYSRNVAWEVSERQGDGDAEHSQRNG